MELQLRVNSAGYYYYRYEGNQLPPSELQGIYTTKDAAEFALLVHKKKKEAKEEKAAINLQRKQSSARFKANREKRAALKEENTDGT